MCDETTTREPGGARRGVVLLEVLVAAAVLATAVLAIATLEDRCVARDAAGDGLLAAARAAENLLAETEMRRDLRAGNERGIVENLPGATFSREVTSTKASAGLDVYRIRISLRYEAGGRARTFSLQRWVVRAHGTEGDR